MWMGAPRRAQRCHQPPLLRGISTGYRALARLGYCQLCSSSLVLYQSRRSRIYPAHSTAAPLLGSHGRRHSQHTTARRSIQRDLNSDQNSSSESGSLRNGTLSAKSTIIIYDRHTVVMYIAYRSYTTATISLSYTLSLSFISGLCKFPPIPARLLSPRISALIYIYKLFERKLFEQERTIQLPYYSASGARPGGAWIIHYSHFRLKFLI